MTTDESTQLKIVTDLMRGLSRMGDPSELIATYRERARLLFTVDRSLSLTHKDAADGHYFVSRSDLVHEHIDAAHSDGKRLLRGGMLGEIFAAGEPRIVDDLVVAGDDPAADFLEGMRSLVAIPHFDDGAAANVVVHLRRERAGFDHKRFPDIVIVSGMFGRAMQQLGLANDLRKAQDDLREQYKAVSELSDTVLDQAFSLKNYSEELEARVRERTRDLEEAQLDAIYTLAAASEAKDNVTGDHIRRVESLTAKLARAMGHSAREAENFGRAAILHDVGKLHVPDHILSKPAALTPEERTIMQHHTIAGEAILPERPFFARARRVARSHHENWDGTGYPDALRGEQIPLEARIVHVADVVDALTHVRPYKKAWTPEQVTAHMREQAGKMFDPAIAAAYETLEQ